MANKDKAFGLSPIMSKDGSGWNGKVAKYEVLAAVADVFIGDCVLKTGTANTTTVQGYKPGVLPDVALSANTGAITGVIVGIEPLTDESAIYGPTGTIRVISVVDDPRCVFEVQSAGTVAVTDIGANANQILGTGSAITGDSATEVSATTATTAATQLKILRMADKEDNALGANAVVEVIINNHTESNNSVAI